LANRVERLERKPSAGDTGATEVSEVRLNQERVDETHLVSTSKEPTEADPAS